MAKVVFINFDEDRKKHNGEVTSHFVPKVMWWFMARINDKRKLENLDGFCLNAKMANRLYKKELSSFFKKYTDEIEKPIHVDFFDRTGHNTDITDEEEKLYQEELNDILNKFYKEMINRK